MTAFISGSALYSQPLSAAPTRSTRCGASRSAFLAPKRVSRAKCARPSSAPLRMLVDPWSVSPEAVDALAAQFFAASLFPYLGFLYLLGRKEVACPKLANFGFQFLLVFVFATIPAGIYAKIHYHDILANIDWLHGGAESLLTVTNLLIVLGMRKAMVFKQEQGEGDEGATQTELSSFAFPTILLVALSSSSILTLGVPHAEPLNALSFPTWIIHVSSLVEWLVAMGLIWNYADYSKNPRWKGLTWGMVPLHTSGICACTYHLFYNAPSLNLLVAFQAALTFFGNATMCAAAYRIWRFAQAPKDVGDTNTAVAERKSEAANLVGFEDLGTTLQFDSNLQFLIKVFAVSAIGSVAVKWGELFFDAPFNPSLPLALGIIIVPTAFNMLKWNARSQSVTSSGSTRR